MVNDMNGMISDKGTGKPKELWFISRIYAVGKCRGLQIPPEKAFKRGETVSVYVHAFNEENSTYAPFCAFSRRISKGGIWQTGEDKLYVTIPSEIKIPKELLYTKLHRKDFKVFIQGKVLYFKKPEGF